MFMPVNMIPWSTKLICSKYVHIRYVDGCELTDSVRDLAPIGYASQSDEPTDINTETGSIIPVTVLFIPTVLSK